MFEKYKVLVKVMCFSIAVLLTISFWTEAQENQKKQRRRRRRRPPVTHYMGEEAEKAGVLKGDVNMHDPAGLMIVDGYVISYCTRRTIPMRYLEPGSDVWKEGTPAFPDGPPEWVKEILPRNKGFWAPHIPFSRIMYYSCADDRDGKDVAVIGRATAVGEPPNLKWVDDGKPVIYCDRDCEEEPFAIDPAVYKGANDSLWMVYGSHWSGIWIVELDPKTGHLKNEMAKNMGWTADNPVFHKVAATDHEPIPTDASMSMAGSIEAPYVYWDGKKYYYLFVNWDKCCSGIRSTYNICVGRSESPYGPFIDKEGRDMAEGGGTMFRETDGRFIGPGHANIFDYKDAKGKIRHIFTYHYYDGEDNGHFKMQARELKFENGWPVLTDKVFRKPE